jgi:hypothetical protein
LTFLLKFVLNSRQYNFLPVIRSMAAEMDIVCDGDGDGDDDDDDDDDDDNT